MAEASPAWLDKLLPVPSHAMPPAQDSTALALGSVVAAVMIGRALQLTNGMYSDRALLWLTWGIVAALAGLLMPRTARAEETARNLLPVALLVGIAFDAGMLHSASPITYKSADMTNDDVEHFHNAIAGLTVLSFAAWAPSPWLKRWHAWGLLLAFLFLGHWAITQSPNPRTDVIYYARDAAKALLHGQNPHSITIPDLYGPGANTYSLGVVQNGRLMVGYPYPPINVMLFAVGSILGDVRYALTLAIAVGVGLILRAQRTWWAAAAMGLLFLMPRNFLLIENAWNEPFVFMFLGGALYTALCCPRYLPIPLGLLLVSKQYVPFLMPVALLLPALHGSKDLRIKQAAVALGLAAVLTLPFVLWSPADFWRSNIDFHIHGPIRTDALSYLSWWNAHNGEPLSTTWSYVLALGGLGLVAWRVPRTAAGMAFAFGFVCFLLMCCNRQAFVNYYWLSIAAFLASVACSQFDEHAAKPAAAPSQGKRGKR